MSNRMSPKGAAVILLGIGALLCFDYCDRHFLEPRRQEETRAFQQLTADSVTSIDMENKHAEFFKLLKGQISIHDPSQIRAVCKTIQDSTRYEWGHEAPVWQVEIYLNTASRSLVASVSLLSRNRTVIDVKDGQTLRNDEMGPMLEKIAAASSAGK